MRILVTGSRGFIGQRLTAALRSRGHAVREFSGDVTDAHAVGQQMAGVRAVYHLAAVLDERAPRQRLFAVNVNGTRNVVEAAATQGVRQLVHLSTAGVHGPATGVLDERAPLRPQTAYEQSKAEAERLVRSYQGLVPVTIIRSALVLGPNEYWRKILEQVRKGFPLIGSGKHAWQIVSVSDLVSALVFVLGKKEALNQTFLVAEEEPLTLRELYEELRARTGTAKPLRTIPVAAAKLVSYGFLARAKLTGRKSIILPQHVDRLVRERRYSIAKIKALGWRPRLSTRAAIQATVAELNVPVRTARSAGRRAPSAARRSRAARLSAPGAAPTRAPQPRSRVSAPWPRASRKRRSRR